MYKRVKLSFPDTVFVPGLNNSLLFGNGKSENSDITASPRMKYTQCSLCLADIPHDIDHSLEIIEEAANSEIATHNEDDTAHHSEELFPFKKSHKLQNWPDSAAIACIICFLFAVNAAVYILWLIVLCSFKESPQNAHDSTPAWIAALYLIAATSGLLNWCLAFAAKRKLESTFIAFLCWIAGSFWCCVLVQARLHIHWDSVPEAVR